MLGTALRRLSRLFGWWRLIARRPAWAITFVSLVAFAGCLLLGWRGGIRAPSVHDEFSYLLAADTFVHGRVTNPSPPLFRHFETPHVLLRPTYMSKYPPGQGLALALGRLITGSAIVGVWLSVAAACAAICWMLLAWVPPSWALAGGLIAVCRLVFLGGDAWWSQRYWGGAVAALGGALLFGAWRRLSDAPHRRNAIWFALGLLILANSRPFEGLALSLPVLAMLGRHALSPGGAALRTRPILRPFLAVLGTGFALMAFYNHRITGHFWEMPHMAFQRMYAGAPQFLWQSPGRMPAFGNTEMARLFVAHEVNVYRHLRNPVNWLAELSNRWSELWRFFIGAPLALGALTLPWVLRDRWIRRVALTLVVLAMGLASVTWFFPHYVAPGTAAIMLVVVECLRHVRALKLGRWRVGRILLPAIAVVCLLQTAAFVQRYQLPSDWSVDRQRLQDQLRHDGGKHLVFVRYGSWHVTHDEWVYNDADLPNAPVVWARALGPVPNRELIAAMPGRTVWTVEADLEHPILVPFKGE